MSWLFCKRLAGFLLLIFVLVGAGCASPPVRVKPPVYPVKRGAATPVSPSRAVAEPLVVPEAEAGAGAQAAQQAAREGFGIDRVARRLADYEGRLYRWRAITDQLIAADVSGENPLPDDWYNCMQQLEAVYDGYGSLRRRIVAAGDQGDMDAVSAWDVVEQDFSYQEGGCREMFLSRAEKPAAKQVPVAVGEREVLGRKVRESVQKGKYKEALAAYDKLANDPSGQIGIAVQQAYVVALLRTNKADSALVELQKLIEQSGDFDSWTVRRQVADLLMATGKQEAAVAGYQELLVAYNALEKDREWVQGQLDLLADNSEGRGEELSVYGEVLRAYLTFDGKRVPGELKMWVARLEYKYPDSPFAVKSRQLLVRVESEAKSWISDKLLGVDALVEARQFKKALAALEDLLGQNLPKEMTDVVREAMGKVVIVEARYQEDMRTQIDERLQKRWLEAVHLYDSEQFDEAMVVFSSLYGTPYDVDARVKIGDAAALAAAKLRKKAATLFFKAGQATDSGSKKELLLQSRQLLQEIMAKYPYVDLIDKVSRNLQIIDEQLLVADPLSYPSMGGGDDQEAGEVTDDAASEESW